MFADRASGSVTGCSIVGSLLRGVWLADAGTVTFEDNDIEAATGRAFVLDYTITSLAMHNNIISGGSKVLELTARIESGSISNNHFLRTDDSSWWVYVGHYQLSEPWILDLSNNYWGTTDTALLDQFIYDGNDDPYTDIYVNYLPLADGPVATETTTWGAVKSLFRDGGQ